MGARGEATARFGHARRRARAAAVGAAASAALAHYLPSACILGQWSPVRLQELPGGWCRWRGPAGENAVALTIDDGPSPATTPRTLDLLDDLGMRATFFVLGSLAGAYPSLVEEIGLRGHEVGLHGHRHEHHLLRTPGWIAADTDAAFSTVTDLVGAPRWYRPPYGQLTARTVLEARRRGMEVVLWSAWGREWSESEPGPVMDRLAARIDDGGIVLLHDTDVSCPPGTAALVHRCLPLLADLLAARNLRAVGVGELIGARSQGRAA
ncbi:MAG: polysaccharide deacetylase family protein [Acidimicrobiales bacterium]